MQRFKTPVLDLENQVKAFLRIGMLMRGHDNRQQTPGIIPEKIIKNAPVRRIKASERLVQQKNPRLLTQRTRNQHTLLLPPGEGVERARSKIAQAQPAQCLIGLGTIRPARMAKRAQMRIPPGQHRLPDHHRKMPFNEMALGEIRDAGIAAGRHGTLNAHFPTHRRKQARQCF